MASNPQHTQQFVSLLTDHQETIRAYIISLLPGNPDIRDILQEVNIDLWEKMHDFKLGTNFGAWACTIAYYKVLDHRKKMKRDGILVFNDELSQSMADETQITSPETIEIKRKALRHCLAKLSDKDRSLLDARYHSPHGNMDQVASETGRSRASLRVSLCRLRTNLRNCITKRIAMEGGVL